MTTVMNFWREIHRQFLLDIWKEVASLKRILSLKALLTLHTRVIQKPLSPHNLIKEVNRARKFSITRRYIYKQNNSHEIPFLAFVTKGQGMVDKHENWKNRKIWHRRIVVSLLVMILIRPHLQALVYNSPIFKLENDVVNNSSIFVEYPIFLD